MKRNLKVLLALLLVLGVVCALGFASAEGVPDGLRCDTDGIWRLYQNGEFADGYTGLYCDANAGWWLINGGTIAWDYTGLWNDPNCGWWLIGGGTIAWDYNGLWNDPNCGWWLIRGGTIAWDYTGNWEDPVYGPWYISGGCLAGPAQTTLNGLNCDADGVWRLYDNGSFASGYTGLYCDQTYGWWLIGGGQICWDYTGLWGDPNYGWWLIGGGQICWDYTGLWYDQNYGWWLINGGTIAWDYTGNWNDPTYGTWYISSGCLAGPAQTDLNGLNCDADGVWRLYENGSFASGYTGLYCDANYGWWLVRGGTVDLGYTGLYNDASAGWWLIGNGTIAWDYNGIWDDPNLGKRTISNGRMVNDAGDSNITVWSIAVEGDSLRPSYLAGIDAYNAENTGSEMTMEATANEAYKTKLRAAMATGQDLPDIFFTWSKGFLGDFVEAGQVYCLDDILPEYKDQLSEAVLANTTYSGKHYGIPMNMNVVTMFVNMDLLNKAGIVKAPETYDELIACCNALQAAGVVPFGVAGSENWCLSEYVEPLLVKTIGSEGLEECYNNPSSWDQEGVVTAMEKFVELKKYFDPDAASMNNEEVKENFIDGKYAFYQNGSWNCGDIAESDYNVQVCMFPVIDAGKSSLYQMIGGPNDSLAVTATSDDPAESARAAFELARRVSRDGTLSGSGIPAWKVDYDTSSIDRLSSQLAGMVTKSDGMVLFGDNFMNADAANTYLNYIAQIFAGEITAEQFAKGLAAELK